MKPASGQYAGFARYAWAVFGYTLFVILYGAWVRITGSGAGCGDHWPSCHGEVVPRSPNVATVIEYTHRVTSGLLGPLVLGLVGWAWLGAGKRGSVRALAGLTLLFVVLEALIGAGLVLGELVADDASRARATVIALHLGNTLVLTAVGALCAWIGAGRPWPQLSRPFNGKWGLFAGLGGSVLTCMSGAVTALGDTLFPVGSVAERTQHLLAAETASDVHFLVQLRIVHPVIAVLVAGLLLLVCRSAWDESGVSATLGKWLSVVVGVQVVVGAINVVLGAPGWLQLVHLLLAQGVWTLLVLMTFARAQERLPEV